MKLTRSVSYAVGVLMQIAQSADTGPMTAAKIARGCHFPPRFLYRILRRLVDAGLLRGISGPGGGYALAKSPRQITLLGIIEGVEAAPEASVLEPACSKQKAAIARINQLCARNADRFAAELRGVSLADLRRADRKRSVRKRRQTQPR